MAIFEKMCLLLFKKFVSVCVLRVLDGFVGGMLLVLSVAFLFPHTRVCGLCRGRCTGILVFMFFCLGGLYLLSMYVYVMWLVLVHTLCFWLCFIVLVVDMSLLFIFKFVLVFRMLVDFVFVFVFELLFVL